MFCLYTLQIWFHKNKIPKIFIQHVEGIWFSSLFFFWFSSLLREKNIIVEQWNFRLNRKQNQKRIRIFVLKVTSKDLPRTLTPQASPSMSWLQNAMLLYLPVAYIPLAFLSKCQNPYIFRNFSEALPLSHIVNGSLHLAPINHHTHVYYSYYSLLFLILTPTIFQSHKERDKFLFSFVSISQSSINSDT